MITSTQPKNEREAAVIARARQLTDFVWTPIRDVPTYLNEVGNTVLLAGEQVTGFPYSSCETNDKFFCENVSFETFLSAIPNPESKLYSVGEGSLRACSYGVVCNGFVRYVFGIPYRVSTKRWFTIKGMNKIKEKGEFTVEDMRLCDVLHAFNDGRNHVSLVTDILRDENGKVAFVEISEAVRPSCKRRLFTPEQFYEKYKPFSLCRYEFIDNVPLLDKETDALLWNSGIEKKRPKITVNNGNKRIIPCHLTVAFSKTRRNYPAASRPDTVRRGIQHRRHILPPLNTVKYRYLPLNSPPPGKPTAAIPSSFADLRHSL